VLTSCGGSDRQKSAATTNARPAFDRLLAAYVGSQVTHQA
jgi:hypothetical protein